MNYLIYWLRAEAHRLVSLLNPSRESSRGRVDRDLSRSYDTVEEEKDQTFLLLTNLANMITNQLTEIIRHDCYAHEPHPENFIGSNFDDESDPEEDELDLDESVGYYDSISMEMRYDVARMIVPRDCGETEVVFEIYFAYLKDLTPMLAPEQPMERVGDKFWDNLRRRSQRGRYNWSLCRVIVYDQSVYPLKDYPPLHIYEADELFDLVEQGVTSKQLRVADEWEVERYYCKFTKWWKQFSYHEQ